MRKMTDRFAARRAARELRKAEKCAVQAWFNRDHKNREHALKRIKALNVALENVRD